MPVCCDGETTTTTSVLDRRGKGNPNSLSDAGVAGLCAMAGAEAAWYNVLINLNGISDDDEWVATTRTRADQALATAEEKAAGLRNLVRDRLNPGA